MKLAYLVSRFPVATETFILRELDAVQRLVPEPVELCSLFAPARPFVHPEAEKWLPRLREPGLGDGLAALLRTHPRTVAAVLLTVVRTYGRRPRRLARALATVPLAFAHARTLRGAGVEHVHAHWATWPALAAWVVWRTTGIPYSFTTHAHDVFVDPVGLDLLVDDAAFVATVSEYHVAFLRRFGSGRTPVRLVRCGLELDRHPHRARRPPATGRVRALVTASLTPYKGHAVLLDALAAGGPGLGRLDVQFVGEGPLRTVLEARVAELGLGARVTFHGVLDEPGVREQLERADVFVLPSVVAANGDMEGLPVGLLEALAAGVPAVSTAQSGIPDLLREEATCLLATPGDPWSLAAALEHLLARPDLAERRATAGRRLIEREFDVRDAARTLLEHVSSSAAGR
ncbi:MAG: glycosyl transferase, group 1 [Solirubrobacterales bacterium]|nr:glycosyl transferase, group 1 [Solirubrobacterales bacterium]